MKFPESPGFAPRGDTLTLSCMELWGGNRQAENVINMPGMQVAVRARTHGSEAGGDVYFLSSCGAARLSRITLADVAGHGSEVAATAARLRSLVRRFVNSSDQPRYAAALNATFNREEPPGTFATAVLASYDAVNARFSLINAGHPRPLLYQRSSATWHVLDHRRAPARRSNLPLGIVAETVYEEHALDVANGDTLLLYTDGVTDSPRRTRGRPLSERDLLEAAARVPAETPGYALLDELLGAHTALDDDATIIAITFDDTLVPVVTARDRLNTARELLRRRAA